MQEEMELLLIGIGGQNYALPMIEVEHITTLPAGFRHAGPDAEEYLGFEGLPLRFISAWNALGKISVYREFAEIHDMLPQRRQDHLDWMAALEDSIVHGVPFGKARSHRDCAFGKWYYGYTARDRRLKLLLGNFEQPHIHIHALADRLLGMAESGGREEALRLFHEAQETTLRNLLAIFDRAETLLGDLQRRVAIIVRADGERHALGADSIQDIVAVPAERITWAPPDAGQSTPRAALVILDDGRIVTVLPWRRFLSGERGTALVTQSAAA